MKTIILRALIFGSIIIAGLTGVSYASEELEKVREAIAQKSVKWQAAENWVTDLTVTERRKLLGNNSDHSRYENVPMIELPSLKTLPAAFDWRDNNGNWITPVRNQGGCGSCWDFSGVAQIESWWNIYNDNITAMPDLSEQFIISCSDNGGCSGDNIETVLDFAMLTGIPPETCLVYQASDSIPCTDASPDWQSNVTNIPGWGYVTKDKEIVDNIKNALLRHPVSASFDVYGDFFYYSGGTYEHTTGSYEGGHAILIVGWDDTEECWICKNSWGPNWGLSGYFRIKWANCGIGTYIPFIYDELLDTPSLTFYPENVESSVYSGDSTEITFTVKNTGSGTLECAMIDYLSTFAFHPDDFQSYDDSSWWCGSPDIGGYSDHWLQFLETPMIDLSATSNPKLTWKGNWAVENPAGATAPYDGWDGCNVWISTDGGQNFAVISPTFPVYNCENLYSFSDPVEGWNLGNNIAGWGGSSGGWVPVEFNLSDFREDGVIIRWGLASDLAYSTPNDASLFGLLVDDILVNDGATTIFSNDGNTKGDMRVKGFGGDPASWVKVSSDGYAILPGDSIDVRVSIDAVGLEPDNYDISLFLFSNDQTSTNPFVVINLTVLTPEHDLAVTDISLPGEKFPIMVPGSVSAKIYNRGKNTESNFKVACTLADGITSPFSDTVSVESLAADSMLFVKFKPLTIQDTGCYNFNMKILECPADKYLYNNSYSATIRTTNFVDGFELDNGFWDYRGGWGATTRIDHHSGARAAHVNNGNSPYANNMDATLTFLPGFDISNCQYATLKLWSIYQIELNKDFCYVDLSQDSSNWTTVYTFTGIQKTWKQFQISLNDYITAGAQKVWVRFHFVSDASGTGVGFLFDDVEIYPENITGIRIAANDELIPGYYKLEQNYPNPFNPTTRFSYQLPERSSVELSIFNFRGQLVQRLVSEQQPAGFYTIDWNAEKLPSGIYFYRFTANHFNQTKKCVLLK